MNLMALPPERTEELSCTFIVEIDGQFKNYGLATHVALSQASNVQCYIHEAWC